MDLSLEEPVSQTWNRSIVRINENVEWNVEWNVVHRRTTGRGPTQNDTCGTIFLETASRGEQ